MAECFVAVILKNLNTPAADAGLKPKTVTMDAWNGQRIRIEPLEDYSFVLS